MCIEGKDVMHKEILESSVCVLRLGMFQDCKCSDGALGDGLLVLGFGRMASSGPPYTSSLLFYGR